MFLLYLFAAKYKFYEHADVLIIDVLAFVAFIW